MLSQVHDHIVKELGESSRTDTIFVLTAIVFNLIVLAVNSSVATAAVTEEATTTFDLILVVLGIVVVLLNVVALTALILGRRTRRLLLDGLVAMYRDNDRRPLLRPLAHVELRRSLPALCRRDRNAGNHRDSRPPDHPVHAFRLAKGARNARVTPVCCDRGSPMIRCVKSRLYHA